MKGGPFCLASDPIMSEEPQTTAPSESIAFFVSPHGFGHAARISAVLAALRERSAEIGIHIFTTVPKWFFEEALAPPFGYHPIKTDIGLVQKNSLEEDIPATVRALEDFLPFDPNSITHLAERMSRYNIRIIVSDISPLGIAVAKHAGLLSVLIENFTWDWIYDGYSTSSPELARFSPELSQIYKSVDQRIQLEPYCRRVAHSITVPPMSRRPIQSSEEVRSQLGVSGDQPLVLITMGGVSWSFTFLDELRAAEDLLFVVPGGSKQPKRDGNLLLLPFRTRLHHADLVATADVVVGKLGYSTVAEAYRSGTPFAFVSRPRFRESSVLEEFVRQNLLNRQIQSHEFESGAWIADARALSRSKTEAPRQADSAGIVADWLVENL